MTVKYYCPSCTYTTPAQYWFYCSALCEDCGKHYGRMCPVCDMCVDDIEFEELDDVYYDA